MKCRICGNPMKSVVIAQNPVFHYSADGRLKGVTGEHISCQTKRYFKRFPKRIMGKGGGYR